MHGKAAPQVAGNFVDAALLRSGQRKRQAVTQPLYQIALCNGKRLGALPPPGRAGGSQGQLLGQQFVELDARPCRMTSFYEVRIRDGGRWMVQHAYGLAERHQAITAAY